MFGKRRVRSSNDKTTETGRTKEAGRRPTDRPMETVRLLRSYIYSGNGRTTVGVPQIDLFPGSLPLPSFLCRIRTKQRKEGPFSLHLPKRYGKENKRAPLFSFAVAATRLNEQQCLCTPLLTLTESHVDPLAPPPYKGGRGRRKRMNGGREKREEGGGGAEHTFAARK